LCRETYQEDFLQAEGFLPEVGKMRRTRIFLTSGKRFTCCPEVLGAGGRWLAFPRRLAMVEVVRPTSASWG
jgi:hypothetical protein